VTWWDLKPENRHRKFFWKPMALTVLKWGGSTFIYVPIIQFCENWVSLGVYLMLGDGITWSKTKNKSLRMRFFSNLPKNGRQTLATKLLVNWYKLRSTCFGLLSNLWTEICA
jgi:hypothetical protein